MKTLREPAIIVALDRQLDDLVRFCTYDEFRILTVDPTFSLGDFDVTITAYRQLIPWSKRSSEHPVFIGPVMVHYKKSFSLRTCFLPPLLLESDQNYQISSVSGLTVNRPSLKHFELHFL